MENNKRSVILECAKKLREQDNEFPQEIRFNKWYSQWDVDECRLEALDEMLVVPEGMYGEEFIVTANPNYKVEGKLVFDIGDMLLIQYLTPKDFKYMTTVYKIFGRVTVAKIDDKDFMDLKNYCDKMDRLILAAFWYCRKFGESDVLRKIWQALGGESIIKEDRLGRRVLFLSKLVEKYKRDKDATLLARLGYVK